MDEYTTLGCNDWTSHWLDNNKQMQYFLFHSKSNYETNKLVTSRLKPRSELYLCENISCINIFSLLDFDIPVEVVTSRLFLSTHSVELVTSFIPVHTFTGWVIDDAASLYCLPFTYIYTKIPTWYSTLSWLVSCTISFCYSPLRILLVLLQISQKHKYQTYDPLLQNTDMQQIKIKR